MVICSFDCATTSGQSPIVLRDLTLIEDRTVESFSLESIKLNDGTQLGWEQVFRATVQPERQAEFDRNLVEIGLPLVRLRQRIAIGDWNRLHEITDQLMIRYSGVDSSIGKTVCVAAMKGRLETDSRAAAVLPFLMACGKSSELPEQVLKSLDLTAGELESGICKQLLPVWFDLESVKQQKNLIIAYSKEQGVSLPNGGYIYLASFSIALEQWDQAKQFLDEVSNPDPNTKQWKQLLVSEVDRRRLGESGIGDFRVDSQTQPAIVAVSQFWSAETNASKAAVNPAGNILEYLKVSALWGDRFPSLASASLYRAILLAESSNMAEEAKTLTAELLRSHTNLYHERLLNTKN